MRKLMLSVIVSIMLSNNLVYADPTANANYTSTFDGTLYTYNFSIENTSPIGFDIYAIGIGFWGGVPLDPNPANQTFVTTSPVGSPPLWNPGVPCIYGGDACFSTSWAGDSISSGYILAGTSLSGFIFSSPTSPPLSVPFAVSFYNNSGAWGFGYNGTANFTGAVPEPETYAMLLAGLGLLGLTSRRRKQNT